MFISFEAVSLLFFMFHDVCVIARLTLVGVLYGFDETEAIDNFKLLLYVCISGRGPRLGEGHRVAAVVLRDRLRHPVRSHYGSLR